MKRVSILSRWSVSVGQHKETLVENRLLDVVLNLVCMIPAVHKDISDASIRQKFKGIINQWSIYEGEKALSLGMSAILGRQISALTLGRSSVKGAKRVSKISARTFGRTVSMTLVRKNNTH